MTLLQPLHFWKTLVEALKITAVTPGQAQEHWDVFEPMLSASCAKSRGRDTVEKCKTDIQSGNAVLWAIHDDDGFVKACGLAEIQERTDGKVCVIRQMGGKAMRDWLTTIETIKEFGRLNGCNRVEFEGRKGWGRVVPDVACVGSIYEVKI